MVCMSRRSRLVVITALGALSCSQTTSNPPPVEAGPPGGVEERPISTNPPRQASSGLPPLADRQAAKSTAPLPDTPARAATRGASRNPRDGQGRAIFLSYSGERCYVELPFPEGEIFPPGSAPPQQDVSCPPTMADAAWLECPTGEILSAEGQDDACLCEIMGNPPPPTQWVHCPAAE
jgi:hypothetical protein